MASSSAASAVGKRRPASHIGLPPGGQQPPRGGPASAIGLAPPPGPRLQNNASANSLQVPGGPPMPGLSLRRNHGSASSLAVSGRAGSTASVALKAGGSSVVSTGPRASRSPSYASKAPPSHRASAVYSSPGPNGRSSRSGYHSAAASTKVSTNQADPKKSHGSHSTEESKEEVSSSASSATVKPDGKQVYQMSIGSDTERGNASGMDDDIFAPIGERVQTFDFSRIRTHSIQLTKNEQKKKTNVLGALKKQVKNFFHEDKVGEVTDEQGNVELPMDPCVQAREDHDSGLVPSQHLFRLARHEQQQLRDRNLQHQRPRPHAAQSDNVDDYEFAWIVKRRARSAAASAPDEYRSRAGRSGADEQDGMTLQPDDAGDRKEGYDKHADHKTTGNTYRSKVGTNTVDFQERINTFLRPKKQDSMTQRSEGAQEMEQEKAQLLSLCGLVGPPRLDVLSEEERDELRAIQQELVQDATDGSDHDRFPCDCCGLKDTSGVDTNHRAARYYDLLFAHRKNDSFTVRFDLVHCLPRFVLHYKFHKQLYDCLNHSERDDLINAATDITLSYSIENCTLQIPFGKYCTNAYPAFFAYVIVPDHARYLELFEVCNPPVKLGERQKKSNSVIPNWPDKSYVTEFWTYSKESSSASDKDPRLTTRLYEKNVLRKLQLVQQPELQVTRRHPPPELSTDRRRTAAPQQQQGDFDRFEDFVLVPHHELPMLGFEAVRHPSHAADTSKTPQPDVAFLDQLLQAMVAYVRRFVNTRHRKQAGREDLSCTINLSLSHSFAFRGHQRVYGFVGFPRGSAFWDALIAEQRRNAALAETAVTQEDIRLMQAAAGRAPSSEGGDDDAEQTKASAVTESSADRSHVGGAGGVEQLQEKLKSCQFL